MVYQFINLRHDWGYVWCIDLERQTCYGRTSSGNLVRIVADDVYLRLANARQWVACGWWKEIIEPGQQLDLFSPLWRSEQ